MHARQLLLQGFCRHYDVILVDLDRLTYDTQFIEPNTAHGGHRSRRNGYSTLADPIGGTLSLR